MKKILLIFIFLILTAVLFLGYLFVNSRPECEWTLKSAQKTAEKVSKDRKKTGKPLLNHLLYFNEFCKQYDSFSPRDTLPSDKLRILPESLHFFKGKKEIRHDVMLVKGGEIVATAWLPPEIMESSHLDLMVIEIMSRRRLELETILIPSTGGIIDKIGTSFREVLMHRVPEGISISNSVYAPENGGHFKQMVVNLPTGVNGSPESAAGFLFRIKSPSNKPVKVKIKSIYLLNRRFGRFEKMPQVDYYRYGGVDRRQLKSVFIPVGSTLDYTIKINGPDSKRNGLNRETGSIKKVRQKEVIMDGYLGSVHPIPMVFRFRIDDKEVLAKKISGKILYFKHRFTPKRGIIKLSVALEGDANNTGFIGNMTFAQQGEPVGAGQVPGNVIYYLVDACRADRCGIKEDLFRTYFKNGAVFQQAYSNGTRTGDSLPSLFTGKYKFTMVDKNEQWPLVGEKEFLLAEYFKSKGYTTAAFVNNPWLIRTNSSQGFDVLEYCWEHVPQSSLFPSDDEYTRLKYGRMEELLHRFVKQNKNKPLFIFIHTMEPHVPYETPLKGRRYSAGAGKDTLKLLYEKVTLSPEYPSLENPSPGQLQTLKALYKDAVLTAYGFFRRIHGYLESESVIDSRSMVIFSSDHGERFYEHRSWIHGPPDVYEEVVRVPLMLRGPGIKPGIYDKNVQLADIYPTVRDWFGDRHFKGLVGQSLLSYTKKPGTWAQDRVIYIDGTGEAVHYVYIRDNIKIYIKDEHVEVYDLAADPDEKKDLVTDERFASMIATAKGFRKKFKKRVGKRKRRKLSDKEKERLKTLGYVE